MQTKHSVFMVCEVASVIKEHWPGELEGLCSSPSFAKSKRRLGNKLVSSPGQSSCLSQSM